MKSTVDSTTSAPPPPPPRKHVRVAIVGSGLTGLVATYLLSAHTPDSPEAPTFCVEIFERADTLGMDSASISVPLPLSSSASARPASGTSASANHDDDDADDGLRRRSRKRCKVERPSSPDRASPQKHLRIDVPMRAFTGGYYPQLLALYRHLGIRTKKTNFTYSFASLPPHPSSSSSSSAGSSSSCSTRSSSPDWHTPAPSKSTASLNPPPIRTHTDADADKSNNVATPSPSILYNGANGVRGVSLPSSLRHPRLPRPVTVSNLVEQVCRVRAYFGSLLVLVLGYLQLLVIALWHHKLGHTSTQNHPLRSHTLRDLLDDPFPARTPPSQSTLRSRILHTVEGAAETVLRWCVRLDRRFAEETLAPLFSAVMTSSLESVWACPASQVLDYVALTLGKDHFVVSDGVRTVVAALLTHLSSASPTAPRSTVWTRAEVRHVRYRHGKAYISVVHHPPPRTEHEDEGREGEMSRQRSSSSCGTERTFCESEREHGPFDHVIFATQANQSARFLRGYAASLTGAAAAVEAERIAKVVDVLRCFQYERSTVLNHTDRALLPQAQADWRDLNLVSPPTSYPPSASKVRGWEKWDSPSDCSPDSEGSTDTLVAPILKTAVQGGYTMATHILRSPSPASGEMLVMQTTNPLPLLQPHPAHVLSTSTFERAVIDVRAHLAREALFQLSNHPDKGAKVTEASVRTAGGRCLALGPLQRATETGAVEVGVWVCGSWATGIPLLEGCVVSARVVAEEILRSHGATLPPHAVW